MSIRTVANTKTSSILLILCVLFCMPVVANAYQNTNPQNKESKTKDFLKRYTSYDAGADSMPTIPSEPMNDSVKEAYNKSLVAYYTYKKNEFHQANNVFYWQLIANKIIFFVAIGLVIAGVWFAGAQFYHSLKTGEKLSENQLEVSKDGIRLHSSVVGLFILLISLAFFYLYIRFVYPIQKV
ncbi:hypothetical protein SAMN05444410_1038 [Hydrobacter penzbergensis]|uniref:Uncharacterized protein n=1 Tax=Hydrobacter penzbergensis TaxID=1235997 RepID=A0A8X8IAA2_9BACT|nr:hypothetical protein [Hydrobacter penzbergensis]SDW45863.1 hypothetical protein SAMN05444410_1038 [Hydrobacter penzbergensis]